MLSSWAVCRATKWLRQWAGYLTWVTDPPLSQFDQKRLRRAWESAPETGFIDALNIASIAAFLEHAAQLEGFSDPNEAIDGSRWRHLPYYIEGCWVPLRSTSTRLISNEGSFPILVASAYGLRDNLAERAALSPHCLGTVPRDFNLMLKDPAAFFRLQKDALDDRAMLQWIWRALFVGATLAIERNAPLW